jgi:DNA gyrase subunit A
MVREDLYLFTGTKQGIVKKSSLSHFANIRKGGLIALSLREDDELIAVRLTDGKQEIIIGTRMGMSIRFPESDVRVMGRQASGVKGISLDDDDVVIDMDVITQGTTVLVVTEKGYGKRTTIDDYRVQSRGGKGVKTLNVTKKNGQVVGLKIVHEAEDLMIITNTGVAIRMHIDGISTYGRNTQGVKLINVGEEDLVSTVARLVATDEDIESEE